MAKLPKKSRQSQIAEDPEAVYIRPEFTKTWASIVGHHIQSLLDYIEKSRTGLTRKNIESLAEVLGIPRKQMAEEVLNISVKTIERKSPEEKLDKKISSHAIEIAKLWKHAYGVFQDPEMIRQWLDRPNAALQGRKPLDLLDTLTGISLVDDVLGRMEEGVYS